MNDNNLKKIESILLNTNNVKIFLNTLEIYLKMLSENDNHVCKPFIIFEEYTPEIAYNDFIKHCNYIESNIDKLDFFDISDLNELKTRYVFKNGEIKKE